MESVGDDASTHSQSTGESAQAGVKRLEAIASTWTQTGLYVAYLGYDTELQTVAKNREY